MPSMAWGLGSSPTRALLGKERSSGCCIETSFSCWKGWWDRGEKGSDIFSSSSLPSLLISLVPKQGAEGVGCSQVKTMGCWCFSVPLCAPKGVQCPALCHHQCSCASLELQSVFRASFMLSIAIWLNFLLFILEAQGKNNLNSGEEFF